MENEIEENEQSNFPRESKKKKIIKLTIVLIGLALSVIYLSKYVIIPENPFGCGC